jgi:hypothetical protein
MQETVVGEEQHKESPTRQEVPRQNAYGDFPRKFALGKREDVGY